MYKDYTRLGGWLMFFVVTSGFGIFGNLMTVLTMLTGRVYLIQPVVTVVVETVLVLGVVALRATVLTLILRRNDTARYWLLGEGVFALVTNCYILFVVAGSGVEQIPFLVGSVAAYVVWFFYLTNSRRVAVYMHPDQYQPTQPFYGPGMPQGYYGMPQMPPMQPMQPPPMTPPTAPPVTPAPPAQPYTPPATPYAPPAPAPTQIEAAPPQGAPFTSGVCARCGKPTQTGARFCGGCGNPLQ